VKRNFYFPNDLIGDWSHSSLHRGHRFWPHDAISRHAWSGMFSLTSPTLYFVAIERGSFLDTRTREQHVPHYLQPVWSRSPSNPSLETAVSVDPCRLESATSQSGAPRWSSVWASTPPTTNRPRRTKYGSDSIGNELRRSLCKGTCLHASPCRRLPFLVGGGDVSFS
jgi:hypothetical protein